MICGLPPCGGVAAFNTVVVGVAKRTVCPLPTANIIVHNKLHIMPTRNVGFTNIQNSLTIIHKLLSI
jgi:hypothetical protein